jgi:regulator of sirC expression with transglutaminase-like and TPR domain
VERHRGEIDVGESAAGSRFAELVARAEVPLAEAALALAEEEYPGLPAAAYLARLEELAAMVAARRGERRDAATTLRLLRSVLFQELGFRGNSASFYDPRNSFLNEVLDRRLGIPITLSIVFMEVASRLGLPLQGVPFPGHFLVKYASGGREVFIDAFHGGELLSADECLARFRPGLQGEADLRWLQAASARQILARMLQNLKHIYIEAGDDVRTLWAVDRMLVLAPDDPLQRRDRGLVEARLGATAAALRDLDFYLEASKATPEAEDRDVVVGLVAQLRQRQSRLN